MFKNVYEIKYNGKEFVAGEEPVAIYSTPKSAEISFAETYDTAKKIANRKNIKLAKTVDAYKHNNKLILMVECRTCGKYYRIESKSIPLKKDYKCPACAFVKRGVFFNRYDMV